MNIKYKKNCELCGLSFSKPKHLSDHIDEKHPNIGQVNYFQKYLLKTPDPKFGKCLVCGEDLDMKQFRFCHENGFRRHVHRKCSKITLNNLKIIYGEEEGQKRWDSYCEKQAKSNSFEYKKEKYGWSEDDFENFNKSRAVTIDNMIAKYGEEEGTKKFNAYCEKQKIAGCSLDYFIDKYGKEEGTKKYEEVNKSKAITMENMIRIYGEIEGPIRFQQAKSHTSFFSKISKKLFDELNEQFKDRNFYYAKNEFGLYDDVNKKYFKYDFTDSKNKIIIEFNGEHFHAKSPDDPNFKNPYAKEITAKQQYEYDEMKKECALSKGYKIYYIWEQEFLDNEQEVISRCINYLNGG